MPKVLKKSIQLPGNFQGVGVGEVSTEKLLWRWYGCFLEQDAYVL